MLSSTTSKNTYTGNGAVDTYAYGFKIFDDDDLLVTVRDTSGVETTLTKTTHYTVSGVGETSGGNVALVNGAFDWIDGDGDLKTSYVLTIRRVLTLSQDLDLRNQGSYLPEDVEDRFDKNVMIAQQQQDEVDRSVKLPETIAPSSFDPTFPADLLASGAGGVPTVNDAGTGWADAAEWPTATEVSAAQGYAQAADASADAALVSESLAEEWAIKVDGIVDSTDYSAKAWAIGGTGVTDTASRGAAKEWATETASTVDGTGYSSKEWAQGTQTRGASGGGSAKDWATYTGGTVDDTGNSAKYWAEDAAATAAGFSSDLSTHEADTTGIHGITDTANLVTKDGAETLTNKTLTTPIISTISNTGTVTLPTATTTLVGRDTTDTMTNKTLTSPVVNSGTLNTPVIDVASLTEQGSTPSTPSSGTKKFYAKTDGKVYTLNSAGEERQVGSGAGAGGKNYLTDLFDGTSVSGINTYADAAAATPVDGTGGSPSISAAALNTTTELRGTSSQRLSKGAADEQGEGWSIDFTVDRQDYEGGKPLFFSMGYETSANYATGDVRMFVYDVTNATLLTVTAISGDGSLTASPDPSKFIGVFYPVSSSSSYRVIFHITSTNASAWDLDVIDLSISPQTTQPGAIVTEPVAYTPTFTGFGTVSGVEMYSWREGSNLVISGRFTIGTPTATEARMTLGFNGTSANVTSAGSAIIPTIRQAGLGTYSVAAAFTPVQLIEPSVTYLTFGIQSGSFAGTSKRNGNDFNTGATMTFFAKVPIANWPPSAALSTSEAMFSTATVKASGNPASATAGNPIIAPTKDWDPLGAYSTSTGLFTAPRTGRYKMYGSFTSAAAGGIGLKIYLDSTDSGYIGFSDSNGDGNFTGAISATKGQTISLRPDGTLDLTQVYLIFEEIPDFSIFSVYGITELLPLTGYSSGGLVNYSITAGQWGDLDSETLTPGEWDVDATATFFANGAVTTTTISLGISTTSGNSSTGLVIGDSQVLNTKTTTTGTYEAMTISMKGITVTASTTYYFKAIAITSITNLQIGWSWRFRRIK